MTQEPEASPESAGEPAEKQLCISCMFPNAPESHFCEKCGAPLSSYAATGPFEQLFAEGHVFREAAERPRSLVVVIGAWMIFGAFGMTGLVMVLLGRDDGWGYTILGALLMAFAVVMIAKTTRNYLARRKDTERRDE